MSDKFEQLVAHIRGQMECETRMCAHISRNFKDPIERRKRLAVHQAKYHTYQAMYQSALTIAGGDRPVKITYAALSA